MMTTLAAIDPANVTMFVVQVVVNIIVGIGLAVLAQRIKKFDGLEAEVKSHAEKLIDVRFESIEKSLKEISDRLQRGDGKFDSLGDRDHALELKFVQRVEDLNRTIVERFATRADVDELRRRIESIQIAKRGAAA